MLGRLCNDVVLKNTISRGSLILQSAAAIEGNDASVAVGKGNTDAEQIG